MFGNDERKDKDILFFEIDGQLKPVVPADKDVSLADVLVMKELFSSDKEEVALKEKSYNLNV